jgi:hypothetical protein
MKLPLSLTFGLVAAAMLGPNTPFAVASLRGNGNYVLHRHEEQGSRVLEASVVGTYLIKDQSRANNRDRDILQTHIRDQTNNVELPDGRIYEVNNAMVGWEISLQSGRDKVLIPEGTVIYSNGKMDVKGKRLSKANQGKNGFVRRNLPGEDVVEERTPEQERNLAALQSSRRLQKGNKTVLAVRIILNDGAYSHATQTGLSNDVFGNGVDTINLKTQYAACSYNQLTFNKAADRSLSTTVTPNVGDTAISNGVVDIRVNHNKAAGDGTVVNAVTAEINRVFGVTNPTQLANYVMYCLPTGVMIGIAYAYINSWNSVYTNEYCNYVSTQMHEVSLVFFLFV